MGDSLEVRDGAGVAQKLRVLPRGGGELPKHRAGQTDRRNARSAPLGWVSFCVSLDKVTSSRALSVVPGSDDGCWEEGARGLKARASAGPHLAEGHRPSSRSPGPVASQSLALPPHPHPCPQSSWKQPSDVGSLHTSCWSFFTYTDVSLTDPLWAWYYCPHFPKKLRLKQVDSPA